MLVEQISGTLVTIAKDVKIQIDFNPAQAPAIVCSATRNGCSMRRISRTTAKMRAKSGPATPSPRFMKSFRLANRSSGPMSTRRNIRPPPG